MSTATREGVEDTRRVAFVFFMCFCYLPLRPYPEAAPSLISAGKADRVWVPVNYVAHTAERQFGKFGNVVFRLLESRTHRGEMRKLGELCGRPRSPLGRLH